ncbi:ABC transporter substrate-binding protein, partial [Patescibacteria group bacterium]|nr:ABC transporter substrate-binding protein [Patescibacteria group bacterium]
MQQLRYFIRFIEAFIKKFKLIIFSSILIGLILFVIIILVKPSFIFFNTQKIGYVGRYTFEDLPLSIQDLISKGLTSVEENGSIKPSLSSSWETNDNGKSWTFKLKDNITWQDGKTIDSFSVNYSFSDVQIEKPDQKTIIFKLNSPFSLFPYVVSKPIFKKGLLGSGEWKVTKASLVRNFVQKLELKNKEGKIKIYKFYPTEDKAKTAFKLGQVNILENIINPDPLDNWETVNVTKTSELQNIVAVFFNVEDKLLSDKNLRQALAYAIDKSQISENRAISPISPKSWAYNPQVKPYLYNVERSKELLKDLPDEMKNNLNITLSSTPILLPTAEKIVSFWKEIGINATVQISPTIPSEYQALIVIFQAPQDPDQYFMWHSTQVSTNISHYRNLRIDKLLEDGRKELNQEQRKKIYWDFQRF